MFISWINHIVKIVCIFCAANENKSNGLWFSTTGYFCIIYNIYCTKYTSLNGWIKWVTMWWGMFIVIDFDTNNQTKRRIVNQTLIYKHNLKNEKIIQHITMWLIYVHNSHFYASPWRKLSKLQSSNLTKELL